MNNDRSSPQPKSKILLLLGLIVLLAAFLRLYRLPSLPPGLNFDEAGNGVAALDILRGAPQLWWRIGGGKEPLWPYLLAVSTTILGNAPLALRLPAALTGVLSVAAVYPLMLRLFRGAIPAQARLIALFSMLGLAFSDWHLHFSRLGFRAILLPLLSTLAFYFFWNGLAVSRQPLAVVQRQSPRPTPHAPRPTYHPSPITFHVSRFNLILSALLTALAIYAYLAGRLLPLVPLLFLSLQWLILKIQYKFSKRYHQPPLPPSPISQSPTSQPPDLPSSHLSSPHLPITNNQLPITNYQLPMTNYLLPLFLFLLPLIIYFLLNPADFTARAGAVSIFNPDWHNGDLLGAAWRALRLTLSTFLSLDGDANPLVNLPHQPALPIFLAPFFVLGLITSLYQAFRPCSSVPIPERVEGLPPAPLPRFLSVSKGCFPSPHLFLLCWWLIMLLPAILAPEGAPHHLRLLGAIVPTYAFVALGFVVSLNLLTKILSYALGHTRQAIRLAYLLPATCYLLLFIQTGSNYFSRWPASTDFTLPFDLYALRLAGDIAHAPADVGYVLPMDIRAGREARHYTLDYLLAGRASVYTYLPVDERNAETLLTEAAQGNHELRVARWTQDKHREADAKEIVTYLLETQAQLVGQMTFPVYNIETYALSQQGSADFKLPSINQPIGATFDGLLRLDAAFVPTAISPGGWLPVALTFAPLAPMESDYKASLRLLGPNGERLVQKDRALRHNFHQGTSLWPPETVNEYYLLPVPPATPPGDYTVTVVIYQPDTLAPLVAGGVVEVPAGVVKIE